MTTPRKEELKCASETWNSYSNRRLDTGYANKCFPKVSEASDFSWLQTQQWGSQQQEGGSPSAFWKVRISRAVHCICVWLSAPISPLGLLSLHLNFLSCLITTFSKKEIIFHKFSVLPPSFPYACLHKYYNIYVFGEVKPVLANDSQVNNNDPVYSSCICDILWENTAFWKKMC